MRKVTKRTDEEKRSIVDFINESDNKTSAIKQMGIGPSQIGDIHRSELVISPTS